MPISNFTEPDFTTRLILLRRMEENTSENLREVYMSDSQIEESTSAAKLFAFAFPKLPAFPQPAVILFSEINNLLNKIIFGLFSFAKQYFLNHPTHAAFSISSMLLLLITLNEANRINEEYNETLISNRLLTSIATKSSFSRNYVTELNNAGAPLWAQKESIKAIIITARRAGFSISQQAVLLATAEVESGFNPLARAKTSSACGLFQFISATGERYGLNENNCTDPWKNAEAQIEQYKNHYDRKILKKVAGLKGLEKAFKSFELSYYLHHDGPASSNPDDAVKAIVLKGTHFLIQAYRELKQEQQINAEQIKFSSKLKESLLAHLNTIKISIKNLSFAQT